MTYQSPPSPLPAWASLVITALALVCAAAVAWGVFGANQENMGKRLDKIDQHLDQLTGRVNWVMMNWPRCGQQPSGQDGNRWPYHTPRYGLPIVPDIPLMRPRSSPRLIDRRRSSLDRIPPTI